MSEAFVPRFLLVRKRELRDRKVAYVDQKGVDLALNARSTAKLLEMLGVSG